MFRGELFPGSISGYKKLSTREYLCYLFNEK